MDIRIVVRAQVVKYGVSITDGSAKHDRMLRVLSVIPTGADRGVNAWDPTSMKKIS